MNAITRRNFVFAGIGAGAGCLLLSSGLARAAWPKKAYQQADVDNTLQALFGDKATQQSNEIHIKAPSIAENGAVVPVTVKTSLPNVENISILVDNNPNPLVASFNTLPTNPGNINTRIKMGKASNVIAVVKSGNKLYTNEQFVKVTIGGCGGG